MLDRQSRATAKAIHTQLCADYGFASLLAEPEANPKVAKNLKCGVMTAPLHLAPYKLSGKNVCARATPGCAAACLHTAGNPAAMAGKTRARMARTRAFFARRAEFMVALAYEVDLLERKAARANMSAAVRLNATSDVRWESVPVSIPLGPSARNICGLFPDVQFYDYTKHTNRHRTPHNYHLTFSLAENNDADAATAFYSLRTNVAVVFAVPRGKPLPATYNLDGIDVPVIDGDESDYRPADPSGVIVGLRAKGRAIGDKSGFVRPVAA